MTKRILLILVLASCFWSSYAQTWNQYKKEAKRAFTNEEYGEALYYLDTLQKIDSAKFDLYFLQAQSAQLYNAFELAEKSYQKVLASKKTDLYPKATLGLATVQKMQGKYDEAIGGFNDYLVLNPDTAHVDNKEARAQIEACKWAIEKVKVNDKDLEISQLSAAVNTDFSDFAPYYHNGKLLFSSLRFTPQGKKADNTKRYSKVLQLPDGTDEAEIFDLGTGNEELHTAHATYNKAGDQLFFNICEYTEGNIIQCKIYTRKLEGGKWGKPKLLPATINTENTNVSQPNVGYNEKVGKEMLFFTTNRTGGKGGKDIWMAYLDKMGQPGNPTNLTDVNSTGDEFSPFFHNYTQTLYFSSDGQKSLGGFDIYKSALVNGKYQEIIHTGFPLNSSYNDVYFSLNHIGSEGYVVSNREGTLFLDKQISACCNDIFKTEFNSYLLDLNVLTYLKTDGEEVELKDVKVTVYEIFDETKESIPHKLEPVGNSHFFRIKSNKKYRVVAEKDNYFPTEVDFETKEPLDGDVFLQKVYLEPLRLNVLTFTDEPPKAVLTDVNVRLFEVDKDGKEKRIKPLFAPDKNSHYFPLLSNRNYKIYAEKDAYDKVVTEFNTSVWTSKIATLTKEIILPNSAVDLVIKQLKPFSLYFDNDSPNPKSLDTTTTLTFSETITAYKRQKEPFKEAYTVGLSGSEKLEAEAAVEKFFGEEIDSTYKEFLKFTDAILKRLEFGRGITVKVQAYASPLASDDYNLRLTKRRISSMLNFYRTYKNNAMRKYVDSGLLNIVLISHGESQAPKGISDSPTDRKNSVYSLDASRQRKVVIVEVNSKKTKKKPKITTASSTNDE